VDTDLVTGVQAVATVQPAAPDSGAEAMSGRRATRLAAGVLAVLSFALLGSAVFLDLASRQRGLVAAYLFTGPSVAFVVAATGAMCVGAVVAVRRPGHPVGWLIWALGVSIWVSGDVGAYAALGFADPDLGLPAVQLAATVEDSSFVPWLTLLTLVLGLTPHGFTGARLERRAVTFCVGVGTAFFVARSLAPRRLSEPLRGHTNALAASGHLGDVMGVLVWVGAVAVNLSLLAAVVLLVRRFWRSSGDERSQLTWVVVACVGVVPLAVVPAVARALLSPEAAGAAISVVVGGGLTLMLAGIAAGVLRYRLYEVDRLLSAGAAYLILTFMVLTVFVVTTLGLSEVSSSRDSSQLRVVASTLAAVAVAGLARRWVQDNVDRRFQRRRYDAEALVRSFLARPADDRGDPQLLLREACRDPSIKVRYRPDDDSTRLVLADGSAAPEADGQDEGIPHQVQVVRGAELVARIDHDPALSAVALVQRCADLVASELDNIRLRAALRARLADTELSRARLARAAADERHRIERNLHDGAQQRLVAVMVSLSTTRLRAIAGVPDATELQEAIDELRGAVRELRELASGLAPDLLNREGLAAGLQDLADRCPVPVLVSAQIPRLAPAVEETAYYVAAEALANAMKHARAHRITVCAEVRPATLQLEIQDDGVGGADPTGAGLLGLADRARVLFGSLQVVSGTGTGTLVRLELPCAS
jgi:signal transduction histidine kinase